MTEQASAVSTSVDGSTALTNEIFVGTGRTTPPVDPDQPNATVAYSANKDATPQQMKSASSAEREKRGLDLAEKFLTDRDNPKPAGEETVEASVEASAEPPAAEAATETETVAEPTKMDAPDPERLARIEKAKASARAAARRDRQRSDENARLRAEADQHRARAEQADQRAARGLALEEAWRKDPLKAIREGGVTPDQLVQQALKDGTPEAKIEALAAQNKALADRIEAQEKEREQRETQARQEAHFQSVYDTFTKAASNNERYPNLQHLDAATIFAMGNGVAIEAQKRYMKSTGVVPEISHRQILAYLNDKLAPAAKKDQPAAPATKAAETPGASKNKPATPRSTTAIPQSGTVSRPKGFDSLPRSKRMEIIERSYRNG